MGKSQEEECNVRTTKGDSAQHSHKTVENPAKQICFAFWSKELGISDLGCTRTECKRVHKEAQNWSKSFVLGQIAGIEGNGDLTKAIENSSKFV
jgi:hypothetical protein